MQHTDETFRVTVDGQEYGLRAFSVGDSLRLVVAQESVDIHPALFPEVVNLMAGLRDGERHLQEMNDTNAQAIEIADKIRRQHNGIFRVDIYLGHDGDNVVTFGSYENNIGKGESGTSLLEAVERAWADWRWRKLVGTDFGKEAVMDAVQVAITEFGGPEQVFNSAGFYQAINTPDAYAKIGTSHCQDILENHPRIVRLSGGAHWLLLPCEHTRFVSNVTAGETEASGSSPG